MSIRTEFVVAIAASLLVSGLTASAATTSRRAVIVASPAVTEFDVAVPVSAAVQPVTGVIIVAPSPLPPVPPNACQRGNSSGVSRC